MHGAHNQLIADATIIDDAISRNSEHNLTVVGTDAANQLTIPGLANDTTWYFEVRCTLACDGTVSPFSAATSLTRDCPTCPDEDDSCSN